MIYLNRLVCIISKLVRIVCLDQLKTELLALNFGHLHNFSFFTGSKILTSHFIVVFLFCFRRIVVSANYLTIEYRHLDLHHIPGTCQNLLRDLQVIAASLESAN